MKIVLTNDGSRTLFSEEFGEGYHSSAGAITEAEHVYLTGSGAKNRLQNSQFTRILEIGFGVGLNFFLTADCALVNGARLDYVGIDKYPVRAELVRQLQYALVIKHPDVVHRFLAQQPAEGMTGDETTYEFENLVKLQLYVRDAQQLPSGQFHCVFHDPFSPNSNAELWTTVYLSSLYDRLFSGGIVATYCCSGEIQRRFRSVGFRVTKPSGPPAGKREMLIAKRED